MILTRKQFLLSAFAALIPNRFKPRFTTPLYGFIKDHEKDTLALDSINAITLKYFKANSNPLIDGIFIQTPFIYRLNQIGEIDRVGGIRQGPYCKLPGESWKRWRETL